MMGKTYRYCPLCGDSLEERFVELEKQKRITCRSCEFIHYQNPTPAAGVIVVTSGDVLLVQRKYDPRKGLWTFPAGFVESGESVSMCAIRETKEETNLDVEIIRLFDVYTAFDDPRAAVVLILYLAKQVGGELRPGDDAIDARFFSLSEPIDDIAFRAHRHALGDIKSQFERGALL